MIKDSAFAKINWALSVKNKREDGFHELSSIMSRIDLHDVVSYEIDKDYNITMTDNSISFGSNLINKVAIDFFKKINEKPRGHFSVEKEIPMQAGLAGGSTDATAALKLLNRAFGNPLSRKDLLEILNRHGSDLAFFVYDKDALVTSRGEVVTPLDSGIEAHLVLIKPSMSMSTPEVYRELKREEYSNIDSSAMVEHFYKKEYNYLVNDLEAPAFRLLPLLKELKENIKRDSIFSLMSGSGSVIFAVYENKRDQERAYQRLSLNDLWVKKACTTGGIK